MEESKRRKISQNFTRLVNETNLDLLLAKLLEYGVFSASMITKYTNASSSLEERKRNLFLDIQTRGPEAFQKLVSALVQTDHFNLAQALDPTLDTAAHTRNNGGNLPRATPFELPVYLEEHEGYFRNAVHTLDMAGLQINHNTEPLVVRVRKATHYRDLPTGKDLHVYPMRSKPRGYLLMINNIEFQNNVQPMREGAQVDEVNLEDLFTQLGYEVFKHRDQTLEEMKRTIKDFSRMEAHKNVDSCVVALMSHGNCREGINDTHIVASDAQLLATDWVLEQFHNSNCPNLRGKPKIFIFQNCRGGTYDFGVRMTTGRIQFDGYPSSTILRTYSDMLICNATLPGYISNRDIILGTWYIQSICEIFMKHAHNTDIEDMLKMVDQKLEKLASEFGNLQTSSYENRGFRKLYFNPGL